jgi:hypothetical protein
LVTISLLHDAAAEVQDASCYVYAGIETTHVFVRELDSDSNPLREIYNDWIKQNLKVPTLKQQRKNHCQLSPGLF